MYDVDETALGNDHPAAATEPLSKEAIENILIPKFKEAVKYAVDTLKMVQIKEIGAGEEDDRPNGQPNGVAAHGPKDPYSRRPLPFIIGTREFQEDDYCGLHYEEEDEPEPGAYWYPLFLLYRTNAMCRGGRVDH